MISVILAWIICGSIALVGGAIIGMVLANWINPERRARNYIALKVDTGKRGHGEVFVIKNKTLAAQFWGVLEGKLFFVKTKRTAESRRKYEELIAAVENKYPGESRHQTALRYIRQAGNVDMDLGGVQAEEVKPA